MSRWSGFASARVAFDQIGRTRVSRILQKYRNTPPAACGDIAMTLVRLAQLAADLPDVRELDINPLIADEQGVLALDARIAVAPPKASGRRRTRLAIRRGDDEVVLDLDD